MPEQVIAEVILTCGRHCLRVAGIVVAMEGDRCRHGGFPESVLDPIPADELEAASIGGKPVKDMPVELVRFFRGDNWNVKMMQYAADQINRAANT